MSVPPRSQRDLRVCAGDLRTQVLIQRATPADDGAGGQTIGAWSTIATCWARVRQLSAREGVAYGAIQYDTLREIIIRYRSGIMATDRVSVDGVLHNIRGTENVQNTWLVITAESGVLPA